MGQIGITSGLKIHIALENVGYTFRIQLLASMKIMLTARHLCTG